MTNRPFGYLNVAQALLPAAYFFRRRCSAFVVGRAILPAATFQAAFRAMSGPSRGKGRLKAGCSQDWLPHKLGGIISGIKEYVASGTDPEGTPCATSGP